MTYSSVLLASVPAYVAEASGGNGTTWWQVVTGILAIPVAVVGIPIAYKTSKKIGLEAKKLQLEILEKEGKLTAADGRVTNEMMAESPGAQAAGTQSYVVRFILLYVTITAWGLVQDAISPLWTIGMVASSSGGTYVTLGLSTLENYLFLAVKIVIFLALGYPLFKDITAQYGLRFLDLIRPKGRERSSD